MTAVTTSHIVLDEHGRPWVEGTNTKVVEIVLDKLAYGWEPEEIHRNHPHLPLSKIYAAFTYYYDHKAEIDAEIQRQLKYVDEMRAAAEPSPLAAKLRAQGKLK
ncbi:MAG: DUF433 domain-containing protein [Tepidisphaeraceae bacterium]